MPCTGKLYTVRQTLATVAGKLNLLADGNGGELTPVKKIPRVD